MGFFTKTVRTTTTRKVKAQQSKSMGSTAGQLRPGDKLISWDEDGNRVISACGGCARCRR